MNRLKFTDRVLTIAWWTTAVSICIVEFFKHDLVSAFQLFLWILLGYQSGYKTGKFEAKMAEAERLMKAQRAFFESAPPEK